MELYSYPKSGSMEHVYEEGQYEQTASISHVAVSAAEYMYDEGQCDHQEAGSPLLEVSTVPVDTNGKQSTAYEDEEELYDAVSVAQSTSQLNANMPQTTSELLQTSDNKEDLVRTISTLRQQLKGLRLCLGIMFTLLLILVLVGGGIGYMVLSQAIAAIEHNNKMFLPVDSVMQLLQTSSGKINRQSDVGRNKLYDSLKAYCDQKTENATRSLSANAHQLYTSLETYCDQKTENATRSLSANIHEHQNITHMILENKTSSIADRLRLEVGQATQTVRDESLFNFTRLEGILGGEVRSLRGDLERVQANITTLFSCASPFTWTGFPLIQCVWVPSVNRSWQSAQDYCRLHDSSLVTFESKHQSDTFKNWASSYISNKIWLGANKLSGTWTWYGLEAGPVPMNTSVSGWHSGHGDDDAADCLYFENSGWNAHPPTTCSTSLRFACERWVIG